MDIAIMTPIVAGVGAASGYDIERLLNLYPIHPQFLLDGLTERLITLTVVALYGFICEAWFGRTLGKVILNMRVVTVGGKRPGTFAIFGRNIFRVFELCHPTTILFCVLSMFVTRRHQRVGDMLAGTAVRIDAGDDDDYTTAREPGA